MEESKQKPVLNIFNQIGLVLTLLSMLVGGVVEITNVKAKQVEQDKQIVALESRVDALSSVQSEISQRMVRIETKLDILIESKGLK
jgi:hypothetical protein